MKVTVTEIADEVFRIGVSPDHGIGSIASFVIRDEVPALVQTNLKSSFGMVHEAVADLVDPKTLRYVFVPMMAMDDCGALNEFLVIAPDAEPVCSPLGGVTLGDFTERPVKVLGNDEKVELGAKTIRGIITPWVPLIDTMMFFDETDGVLFTGDLFAQPCPEPITDEDRSEAVVMSCRFLGAFPSRAHLDSTLDRLEALDVKVLACMHGSVLAGDPTRYYRALRDGDVAGLVDVPFYETGFPAA